MIVPVSSSSPSSLSPSPSPLPSSPATGGSFPPNSSVHLRPSGSCCVRPAHEHDDEDDDDDDDTFGCDGDSDDEGLLCNVFGLCLLNDG